MAHTRVEIVEALASLPGFIGGIVTRTERVKASPEIADELKKKIESDWARANGLLKVYGLTLIDLFSDAGGIHEVSRPKVDVTPPRAFHASGHPGLTKNSK